MVSTGAPSKHYSKRTMLKRMISTVCHPSTILRGRCLTSITEVCRWNPLCTLQVQCDSLNVIIANTPRLHYTTRGWGYKRDLIVPKYNGNTWPRFFSVIILPKHVLCSMQDHKSQNIRTPIRCSKYTHPYTMLEIYAPLHNAQNIRTPTQCSKYTHPYTMLKIYAPLQNIRTPTQCSKYTHPYTMLKIYAPLHNAQNIRTPTQCSKYTHPYTMLKIYAPLHNAQNIRTPTQCSKYTHPYTILKIYAPLHNARMLCMWNV